jgi:GntR family transcriptional regulator
MTGGCVSTYIDRTSPLPAWAQAAQHLRRQIETGRLSSGERLPSEVELADAFQLSRLTVRRALGELSSEGLIERRQGIGTFVVPRKVAVQHDLSLSSSWRQRFLEEGHKSSSELLEASLAAGLPTDLAARVAPDEVPVQIFFLKRLHRVDSEPIGVTESWVPVNVAPGLIDQPLEDGSLSATLRSRYARTAANVDSTLETILASAADAQLLGTVTDVPLFAVTAVSRQKDGDLLELSRTLWVGGRVRFRFVHNNGETGANLARGTHDPHLAK